MSVVCNGHSSMGNLMILVYNSLFSIGNLMSLVYNGHSSIDNLMPLVYNGQSCIGNLIGVIYNGKYQHIQARRHNVPYCYSLVIYSIAFSIEHFNSNFFIENLMPHFWGQSQETTSCHLCSILSLKLRK